MERGGRMRKVRQWPADRPVARRGEGGAWEAVAGVTGLGAGFGVLG